MLLPPLFGKGRHLLRGIRSAEWRWCQAAAGIVVWTLNAVANAQALEPSAVDPDSVTVCGLSADGFMALQFAVAHSAMVRGVSVIAGGLYYCARLDPVRVFGVCRRRHSDWHDSVGAVNAAVSPGAIDPPPLLSGFRGWRKVGAICMLHCTVAVRAGADYAVRSGVQIQAIAAMIERLEQPIGR
jgi:pimeloyl-ACP methyl ester carboxylesterase